MNLNPAYYNLHTRTKLEQLGDHHLGIVKLIKSRLIRKDAEKIIEMSEQIRNINPQLKVSLICSSNICSKSIALLEENKIEIVIRA